MYGPYELTLKRIMDEGRERKDRTGVGTKSLFGLQFEYDLTKGFPLITSKKVHFKSVVAELIWMLRGETNIKSLNEQGVTIWDEWADDKDELGPVYGHQWRHFGAQRARYKGDLVYVTDGLDQIKKVMESLEDNPFSRRHIVTAWNPLEVDKCRLPPCHCFFQFFVEEIDGKRHLSCKMYQRSADFFLGVPFNIASYALLTHIIADALGYVPHRFIWTGGDCHIYSNHYDQVTEQLGRNCPPLPKVEIVWQASMIEGMDCIDLIAPENVVLTNYNPHPPIKAPVAV